MKKYIFGPVLICFICFSTSAFSGNYYVHWNPVVTPKTIFDYYKKCSEKPGCNVALKALAASVSVPLPPDGAAALIPSRSGEDFRFTWASPPGESICDLRLSVISANTATFGLTKKNNQLFFYSYVRRKGLGKGRSWVDAVLYIKTVRGSPGSKCRGDGIVHDQRYGV